MLISTVFSSCTVEKRHYRNGFYVQRPTQHRNENVKEIALRDTTATEQRLDTSRANVADEEPQATPGATPDSSLAANDKQVVTEMKVAPDAAEPERVFKPGKHHSAFPSPASIEKNKKTSTICAWLGALFLGTAIALMIVGGMIPPFGTIIVACLAFALLFIILASVYYPRKATEPVQGPPPSEGGTKKTILTFALFGALFLSVIAVIGAVIFIIGDIR